MKKEEIREILTYIKDRKETLSKHPVTRQGESNIELETEWIDKKVSEVRDYLSNTACTTPPLEAVHREFTRLDLYDVIDHLCMREPHVWYKYETPKLVWGALTILDRWVKPKPSYDAQVYGPDGLLLSKSKSKQGRMYRSQLAAKAELDKPDFRAVEPYGQPEPDPEYWERAAERRAEVQRKYEEDKLKAKEEILKELRRRERNVKD